MMTVTNGTFKTYYSGTFERYRTLALTVEQQYYFQCCVCYALLLHIIA